MFTDKVTEIQKRMISLALEYVNYSADTVYIYASCERNVYDFNVFYNFSGKMLEKHELEKVGNFDVSLDRQFKLLELGVSDFEDFCDKFANDNKEIPTQIKIIYDNKNHKVSARYSYDIFYSNSETLTSDDIFEQWFEEEKAKLENK